ncbi:MAG TPA: histidinol dehydrogenase, partial [Cellvibrio sp.]
MSDSIITRLDASQSDFNQRLDQLLAWESVSDTRVASVVDDILHQVKTRGDAAVVEFTNKFDRRTAQSINDFVVTP